MIQTPTFDEREIDQLDTDGIKDPKERTHRSRELVVTLREKNKVKMKKSIRSNTCSQIESITPDKKKHPSLRPKIVGLRNKRVTCSNPSNDKDQSYLLSKEYIEEPITFKKMAMIIPEDL